MERHKTGVQGVTITIRPSATADTRTCDFKAVTREQLLTSSRQHIGDVQEGLAFFRSMLSKAAEHHDIDKIRDIDGFHRDFVHGFDPDHQTWWTAHRELNRHHLTMADGVPDDVNLIDVLDYITDCVMAGMARSGGVTPVEIDRAILERAFDNTVAILKRAVVVERVGPRV